MAIAITGTEDAFLRGATRLKRLLRFSFAALYRARPPGSSPDARAVEKACVFPRARTGRPFSAWEHRGPAAFIAVCVLYARFARLASPRRVSEGSGHQKFQLRAIALASQPSGLFARFGILD